MGLSHSAGDVMLTSAYNATHGRTKDIFECMGGMYGFTSDPVLLIKGMIEKSPLSAFFNLCINSQK